MSKKWNVFKISFLLFMTSSSFVYCQMPHDNPQKVYRYCYSVQSKELYKKWKITPKKFGLPSNFNKNDTSM